MSESKQSWISMQTKTFTKWTNNKLEKANFPTISNLFTDLRSGIPLVHLLHAIGNGPATYNKEAQTRIKMMENVSFVLDCIKGMGITLVNIGPSDIVDGDQKLILGLIWTIISRAELGDSHSGSMYAMREELLEWVKSVTRDYDNISVRNFTTSWKDGLAFNAIIHAFRPALIDYNNLVESEHLYNLNNAFRVADQKLSIPRLLDAEDVANSDVPDEKSIITYLLQYYQKFKSERVQSKNKASAAKFLKALDLSLTLRHEYEEKARAFINDKTEFNERMDELAYLFSTIVNTLGDFEKINDDLMCRSMELSELLWRIRDLSARNGIKSYEPSAEIAGDAVDASYFDSTRFDIEELKQVLMRFEGEPAKLVTEIKTKAREMFSTSTYGKSQSDAMRSTTVLCGKAASLNKTTKEEVGKRINMGMADHIAYLGECGAIRKDLERVIEIAEKLFKVSDIKATGEITKVTLKKIVKALKLDCDWDSRDVPVNVTLDQTLKLVSQLYSEQASPACLKSAFNALSDGKSIQIDAKFKAIPQNDDGSIDLSHLDRYIL